MSEAFSRRQFLGCGMGLAGLAVLEPQLLAQGSEQDTLIPLLKDVIKARHEISLGRQKEIPAEALSELEKAITATGLDKTIVGQLERLEDVPALTEYFAKKGLTFRRETYHGLPGYELLRRGQTETRKVELFKKEYEIPTRVLIDEPIPHLNAEVAKDRKAPPIVGFYHQREKIVELRPDGQRVYAALIYDDYIKEREAVTKQLQDLNFLDQFVEGPSFLDERKLVRLKPEFWGNLSKQLHHVRIKELADKGLSREETVDQLARDMAKCVMDHEAVHFLDFRGDWSFMKDIDERFKDDIVKLMMGHSETRAYLIAMHHGHGRQVGAHACYRLSRGELVNAKGYDPNHDGCEMLWKHWVRLIRAKRKDYASLDFSLTSDAHILKQAPKLSEGEWQTSTRGTLELMYKGKNLCEYIKSFVPEPKK